MRQLYAYVANESIRGMCSPLNSHVLTKKNVACNHAHFFSALLLIFTLLDAIVYLIFLPPLKNLHFVSQRNQSPLHFPLALASSF